MALVLKNSIHRRKISFYCFKVEDLVKVRYNGICKRICLFLWHTFFKIKMFVFLMSPHHHPFSLSFPFHPTTPFTSEPSGCLLVSPDFWKCFMLLNFLLCKCPVFTFIVLTFFAAHNSWEFTPFCWKCLHFILPYGYKIAMVWIHQIFLSQSPINGHLVCLYVLAMVHNVAMNIAERVFLLLSMN